MDMPKDNLKDVDFSSVFTMDELMEVESNSGERDRDLAVNRRVLLAFLTKSKKELVESVKEEEFAEVVMEVVETSSVNIKHMKGVLEMMEAAVARLIIALYEAGENIDAKS